MSVSIRKTFPAQYWPYALIGLSILLVWPFSRGYIAGVDLGTLLCLIYVEVELALFQAISRVPFMKALLVVIVSNLVMYLAWLASMPVFLAVDGWFRTHPTAGTDDWLYNYLPYTMVVLVILIVAIKALCYIIPLRRYGISHVFLAAVIANLISAGLIFGLLQLIG